MGAGCAFRRRVSELSRQVEAIAIHKKGFSPKLLRFGPHGALPKDAALP